MLKQLIDNLGLNLEHLLAKGDKNAAAQTLKAALLELAHNFGAEQLAKATQKSSPPWSFFNWPNFKPVRIPRSSSLFPCPLSNRAI